MLLSVVLLLHMTFVIGPDVSEELDGHWNYCLVNWTLFLRQQSEESLLKE